MTEKRNGKIKPHSFEDECLDNYNYLKSLLLHLLKIYGVFTDSATMGKQYKIKKIKKTLLEQVSD